MHILITGGTGLIGTAISLALNAEGHQLTVLTRRERPATQMATFITDLGECAGPVDAVINLAGAGLADRRWSTVYKRQIVSSRVDLTRNLVNWLSELDQIPKKVVSASAIGYYGLAGENVFSEDSHAGKGFAAELCQSWEQEAMGAEASGAKVVILRLGVVLAKQGGALGKMTQSFRVGVETWLGSGSQWLSWIHLEDVVRVILHVLQDPSSASIYNAVAPEAVRHRTLAHEAGRYFPTWVKLGVPPLIAKLIGGEMAEELLLGGQRVVPQRLIDSGFEFQYPTLEAALANLMS